MDALYEICLLTADSGVDATGLYGNPKLPGYVWAAPNGALEPSFAVQMYDADQRVDYPAHLHIIPLPEVQSGGWGRRLIETELDALRKSGAKGVQLGVSPTNIRAQGFYKHVGFT